MLLRRGRQPRSNIHAAASRSFRSRADRLTTVFLAADRPISAADLCTILVIRATDCRANRASWRRPDLRPSGASGASGFPVSRDIPAIVPATRAAASERRPYDNALPDGEEVEISNELPAFPAEYSDKVIVATQAA